ncbi:hypothetical protein HD806DRAFT_56535 [Xylariaceae sp. AK1471]|nr:hypothetical protein HD806DRAFT_56535 [Xylariaceae sp. AK1471]
MGDDTTTGQRETQKKPPLSCTSCRARKLKCDKQDPCRNCVRSGSECVFPARKRIQRPRKTKNAELLQRLNRLESIVGKVGLANLEEADAEVRAGEQVAEPLLHPAIVVSSKPHNNDDLGGVNKCVKRTPQDSTASRYLSGQFWSSLCDEVGGLRQALEQSTDSDDEDAAEAVTPESAGGGHASIPTSPGMLLGTIQTSAVQKIEHPAPDHIRYLASAYFRNVDMHLKILHRPTILNALYSLAGNLETTSDLSPEREALFFAIYYAAVTTLSSVECTLNLGRPRVDLSALFQAGIERALVRANYLNNASLETLQALTLYTCCLRSHNGSRASWALLGLPIRLAQALNIHQDGDGTHSRFSPYEAELRRRLWWQLIVLDIRAAEDRGTNTIIAHGSYDTRLPHNIDDVEFGPDTTTPLQDRPGPSDTTFSLCTAQSSGIFLWFEHAQGAGPIRNEEDTVRQAQYLESQFVKDADPGHVGSYLASVTVRLIILKMWLVMRYPLHRRDRKPGASKMPSTLPPASASDFIGSNASGASSSSTRSQRAAAPAAVSRESTLRTAISIMELADFVETGPYSDRFRWWSDTYVQWHPLAVALAELCTQTQGETVERAWQVVEDMFPRWSGMIADAKSGSLWRPIRKLYKKAKAAKETAMSKGRGGSGVRQKPSQSQSQPQVSAQLQSTRGPSSSTSASRLLSGLELQDDEIAIDPALTAPKSGFTPSCTSTEDAVMRDLDGIRPRLIGDMIISESSAHTLTSIPPTHSTTATTISANTNPSIDMNQSSAFSSFPNTNVNTETNTGSALLDFGGITSDMAQISPSWFAWPDVSFDMPTVPSASTHDSTPSQAPASAMTNTVTGREGPLLTDPALLDNRMDWSTWDEFVLDTCATPKSGSGGSDGT